jgi:hypothetical protein
VGKAEQARALGEATLLRSRMLLGPKHVITLLAAAAQASLNEAEAARTT